MGFTTPWCPRTTVPHRFREAFFDDAFEVELHGRLRRNGGEIE